MARTVNCIILGCESEGLELPPMPGALGKRIYESVSREAWQRWVRVQTMIINENRLNLADPSHRKYLTEQIEQHFFGNGADRPQGYVPPSA
ncbi:MAG: oxidative damage protection protein [Betaproteobacteria bacterium]|nr:oxidative damage protection protein [Betaproteobacteria bacterium]